MELQPGMEVDRYRIEQLLGRGGMASVWKVTREDLGVSYALKVLEAPGRSVRERLRGEARIQATLRHPNIVSVVDVLTLDGAPALVLEFVDGPTLDQLLSVHRMDHGQMDQVVRGILKGVRAAHKAGFVHRDLKPANVLMARTDDGFLPKIADFGLAKALRGSEGDLSRTRTGAFMGTPIYMAPEQFRSAKNVDERADIYALGVIAYEICTGRRPYDDADLVELLDCIREQRYPPLAEIAPDLPPRMRTAIEGAMVVDPDSRFASVQEMYDAWRDRSPEDATAQWDRALLANFDLDLERRNPSGATFASSYVPPEAQTETREPPSPPPTERSRNLAPALALTGVAGVGLLAAASVALLVVLGVVGWHATAGSGAEPPEPAPVVSTPRPSPPPLPLPPPVQVAPEPVRTEPPPEEVRPSIPEVTPRPVPAPGPAPSAPTPAPPPKPEVVAPPPGTVRVEGDAVVTLRDTAGKASAPGAVPPGTYTFEARFPGGAIVTGSSFDVASGATRTVSCKTTFGTSCSVK
ncbi:MAG: protein kinase [Alphaproteobacteria bacterium]|nr:protein kinase [Alphaproteobacteria bacterium]